VNTNNLTLDDPRTFPKPISVWLKDTLQDKLIDTRNAILIQDITVSSMLIPFAVLLFVPGVFSWSLGAVYLALLIPRLGPFAVILHMANHRRLFRTQWRLANHYVLWVLPFFFGHAPGSYKGHHLGMHHAEGNGLPDKSSTLPYQRDSIVDFCRYWLRFQIVGKLELLQYLHAHKRRKLFRRVLLGESLHKGLLLLLLLLNWQAALVVIILPYMIVRWGVMMGNWTQHAFIDIREPNNPYKNSVTLINCPYNHRMYNDGYHCGHHVKATVHWADVPATFEANVEHYAANQAVVFDGIRGFQRLWMLLMLRRYDVMACHLVVWEDTPRSTAGRVAFLKARVRPR